MLRKDYTLQFLLSLLLVFLTSCDKGIYDSLEDCPSKVFISFYTQSPCATEPARIGEVPSLYLFAFDENGTLVWAEDTGRTDLSKDFEYEVDIRPGVYTFCAWAGLDERTVVAKFIKGQTNYQDLFMTIMNDGQQSTDLTGLRIWKGSAAGISVHNQAETGEEPLHLAINMQEIINRINVEISLHESIIKDADPTDFGVIIKSGNGIHHIDGMMPYQQPVLTYPANNITVDKTSVKASFTLPTLKTGYNSTIKVYNKKTNEVIWENDLIGSILLKGTEHNISLDCTHDFNVKFEIRDKCLDCYTFICWAIYLNDWMIHSYKVDIGNDY